MIFCGNPAPSLLIHIIDYSNNNKQAKCRLMKILQTSPSDAFRDAGTKFVPPIKYQPSHINFTHGRGPTPSRPAALPSN